MKKILFICVHNSGRSQIAETYANHFGGGIIKAESAGLKPRPILAEVVTVMEEKGYDLSRNLSTSVFELFKQGKLYDYVVTVCEESVESECPVFPGITKRLSWPFPDPEKFEGNEDGRLLRTREIRDQIRNKVKEFVEALWR